MNGNNILIDTNILLYLLAGDKTLLGLLEERKIYLSFISQLESLCYKGLSQDETEIIKQFLSECIIIDINPVIKDYTISLKKKYSLKLPDAIIAATSIYLNTPFLTADNDFNRVNEIDLIFYER